MTTEATGEGAGRRWLARALFLGFVAFQVAVPLSYYLRDDPYDERFAWRMFSGIRVQTCHESAYVTRGAEVTPVDEDRTIHGAWRDQLERGRRPVIERFLARLCSREGTERAAIENTCSDASGRPLPVRLWELDCAGGPVHESRFRRGAVDDR